MSSPSTLISLDHVSKTYRLGDQVLHALDNVSLEIHEAAFIAIVGASGSGKSTFLNMASILDKPSSGKILIKGQDVTTLTEKERAQLRNKEIGFIFQQFNLLAKTSAVENVALPLIYAGVSESERYERATAVLEKVGLGDRLNNTPAQLSGGQQQRVAIARALVNNPSVIFADEPTGNLDTKSGGEIEDMLVQLNKEGRTIVMVTHDTELAQIAKRLVTMQDGKVVSDNRQ